MVICTRTIISCFYFFWNKLSTCKSVRNAVYLTCFHSILSVRVGLLVPSVSVSRTKPVYCKVGFYQLNIIRINDEYKFDKSIHLNFKTAHLMCINYNHFHQLWCFFTMLSSYHFNRLGQEHTSIIFNSLFSMKDVSTCVVFHCMHIDRLQAKYINTHTGIILSDIL